MLIILTAWFVHNWWKLLLGIIAIVLIFEYHYYKKPAKEKAAKEAEEKETEEAETKAEEASQETEEKKDTETNKEP